MRPVGTAETPALYAAGLFQACLRHARHLLGIPGTEVAGYFQKSSGTLAPRNEFVSRDDVAQRTLGGFGNADTRRHFNATRPEAVVHDKEV
jgi:hypothetical protein